MRNRRKAFTFVEILLAITVIAIFFGLIFAFYKNAINKAKYVEAVATVANIAKTEEMQKFDTGEYVAAANTQEVNERLGLNIEPRWFNYKVIGVTDDNFIVLAERILDDIESGDLTGDPIVVARDSSGPISPDSIGDEGTPESGDSGTPPGSSSPGGGGSPGASSPGGSPGGAAPEPTPSGGGEHRTTYNNSVDDLMTVIHNSASSMDLYDTIVNNGISVEFADLLSIGALGLYMPTWWNDVYGPFLAFEENTIYIDQMYRTDYPPEIGAVVVAHEAGHGDWNYNTAYWAQYTLDFWNDADSMRDYQYSYNPALIPDPLVAGNLPWVFDDTGTAFLEDSVTQEYTNFEREVILWKELTGRNPDLTNEEFDDETTLYDQHEHHEDLFNYVASLYTVPPYTIYKTDI